MSKIFSVSVDMSRLGGALSAVVGEGPRSYGFVVWELDPAANGELTNQRARATGVGYQTRQEALREGNKVRDCFEADEAKLLAGDRELAASKIELGDERALREQIQRQGCFL